MSTDDKRASSELYNYVSLAADEKRDPAELYNHVSLELSTDS